MSVVREVSIDDGNAPTEEMGAVGVRRPADKVGPGQAPIWPVPSQGGDRISGDERGPAQKIFLAAALGSLVVLGVSVGYVAGSTGGLSGGPAAPRSPQTVQVRHTPTPRSATPTPPRPTVTPTVTPSPRPTATAAPSPATYDEVVEYGTTAGPKPDDPSGISLAPGTVVTVTCRLPEDNPNLGGNVYRIELGDGSIVYAATNEFYNGGTTSNPVDAGAPFDPKVPICAA